GQYECACPVGFNGSRCEVNINDCESNTCCLCRNRGSCYPHPYYPRGSGQYECACPVGFNGSRCEVNINDCESNTCVNGRC
ncbi:predicted protein, partial [Nematostella vectensis]